MEIAFLASCGGRGERVTLSGSYKSDRWHVRNRTVEAATEQARTIRATSSNCAPARLCGSYCVPARLALLMTLAQRTVSDFT
jgi:hypothetical protein